MTSDLEFARRIALRMIETRSRSEAELREKLAAKAVPPELIDELMSRFTEVGLIDDEAYARALVRTRGEVNRHGYSRIRRELQQRGVDADLAEAALAELEPEQELSNAMAFATRRMRTLRGLEPHVIRRRLHGALARRGFNGGICTRVVEELLAGDGEDHPGPS
ncbi:MAG: regulatory protein RecX [Propionibacteriaceae bacterium]|nr:regulatory protein RecX [Propionibacteriaceae bacterium]